MKRTRRPASRRVRNLIGIVIAAGFTIYGAVELGLGISAFINEHALATSGVPTVARVTATSGYGNDTIQVTYQVDGRQVQGTVGADPSSAYQGEVVAVVYDPGDPSVVSLPSAVGNDSSAWADVIVGAIFLLLFPVTFLLSMLAMRRRRRRAVRAALGE
jgi:Protein of unknown function (DUF3592)